MKRLLPSLLIFTALGVAAWQLTACKRSPSPPAVQDAIAVWNYTHRNLRTQELLGLTKINGEIQKIDGNDVYTLYYEAKVKDLVQLGNRAPGTVEAYQSNYAFRWTEKGWMGPDDQVYPAR